MIKTEALEADLSHIEKSVRNRTKWVKIVKSMKNIEEIYDDKREITCVAINNSTDAKIKKLKIELTAITKAIEEDSIIQPLSGLHSKLKGTKQFFHGDYDLDSIFKLKKGKNFTHVFFPFPMNLMFILRSARPIFLFQRGVFSFLITLFFTQEDLIKKTTIACFSS